MLFQWIQRTRLYYCFESPVRPTSRLGNLCWGMYSLSKLGGALPAAYIDLHPNNERLDDSFQQ